MVTRRSLKLFHQAAAEVPAYADFLKVRGVSPAAIKRASDYKKLPVSDKKNYLQQYPLPQLVWQGNLDVPMVLCATSGSTGIPYYFPRDEQLSWQYSWLIEDFLRANSQPAKQPALVIIAFGMGVWIGGVITLRALEIAIKRMNYPASLLPTGYNKQEVVKALDRLAPQYGQTILVGYPPFLKEIIDEAGRQQINLAKFNTRLLSAAEAYTESFRDYICKKTGADPLRDTLNIYGTADLGAMAGETPLSILIRRLAVKNPGLFDDIFGQIEKTPTLAQFNPRFVEFEAIDGEILLSGNSVLPLIRYAVGDHGGVISYAAMERLFAKRGLNLAGEIKQAGISQLVQRRPFVYVYERSNFAVTLHGITLYPEFIKEALLAPELNAFLSGKFTMITKFDQKQNQYVEINVELQEDSQINPRLRSMTKRILRETLIEKSSEYAEISKAAHSQRLVKLVFWPYAHPNYFAPGVKQKWVLRST